MRSPTINSSFVNEPTSEGTTKISHRKKKHVYRHQIGAKEIISLRSVLCIQHIYKQHVLVSTIIIQTSIGANIIIYVYDLLCIKEMHTMTYDIQTQLVLGEVNYGCPFHWHWSHCAKATYVRTDIFSWTNCKNNASIFCLCHSRHTPVPPPENPSVPAVVDCWAQWNVSDHWRIAATAAPEGMVPEGMASWIDHWTSRSSWDHVGLVLLKGCIFGYFIFLSGHIDNLSM